uniref:Association with the SNF1 complex (ASC) domain-containing protein n=3 Tax=Parascaris univalens TaxID=6257 RepID=A0A915AUS3_PARUN
MCYRSRTMSCSTIYMRSRSRMALWCFRRLIAIFLRRFSIMDETWDVSRRWEDLQLPNSSEGPVEYSACGGGILCTLKCEVDEENENWAVILTPEEAFALGCALLVDLLFTLDERPPLRVERELCETEREVLRVRRSFNKSATVSLCFRVVDLYTVHDLSMPSAHRSFQLICEGELMYVDTTYLASLGGSLFADWHQMKTRGESRTVVSELSLARLSCLIEATSKFGAIVVTANNYEMLLSIASMYKIGSILRKVESCLIEMKNIDPIRKLEFAAIYQLAQLGDVVSRKLLSSGTAIHVLHQYLRRNNETLRDVHPDVLLSLNIHPGYIIEQ